VASYQNLCWSKSGYCEDSF